MIPVFSAEGREDAVITRARFTHAGDDSRAMCIESTGAVTVIDLAALKFATSLTYTHRLGKHGRRPGHLLEFNCSADGRVAFIGDSFGNVTIDAVCDIGQHLSKAHAHLMVIEGAHEGGVFSMVPSPKYEFMLYTGGGDGMLRVWDTRYMAPGNPMLEFRQQCMEGVMNERHDGTTEKPLHELWAHKNAVSAICFPDDALMLSSGVDENLRLWGTARHSVIATIRSYGTALGVWDVAINPAMGRAVVAGQSADVWAFDVKEFIGRTEPEAYGMATLDIEDGDPEANGPFARWRRICCCGMSVVVPTINSAEGVRAVVIDLVTGKEVTRIAGDTVDRIHAVDAHPRLNSGLLLTGGVAKKRALATVWMEGETACAFGA